MKLKRTTWRQMLFLFALSLVSFHMAQAEDPCANTKRRALVLSGGGPKGAFETGAIYHLVIHRNCDFHEFSGSSIGALNGALLAQAAESADPTESHTNLAAQTEALVSLWQSIKGPRDVMKRRRFATLRFGLFGLENLNDFQPLRRLLAANISTEKLAKGRPTRAGVVSFWDGGYREVLARPAPSGQVGAKFLDYLYASSVPPLYGKLPRIADGSAADDPKKWPQFTDGGLRHITPVVSYFKICKPQTPQANGGELTATDGARDEGCSSSYGFVAPPHEPLQQLFVIVTSPYSRDSDLLPVADAKCCRPGRKQITDGRKILGRTLVLLDDAAYRWDLDFLLFANDMLRWRWQAYRDMALGTSVVPPSEAKRQFLSARGFAVESYNHDPQDPDAPSLPYDVGLVVPDKEYAEISNLLTFSPPMMQEQLYCGCLAADRMMQRDFDLRSLSNQCAQRFPPLAKGGKRSAHALPTQWAPAVCGNPISPGPGVQELAVN
jgi:Patatin-like phospholipase